MMSICILFIFIVSIGGSTYQFSAGSAKPAKPASAVSTRPAPAKTSPAKPASSLPAKPASAPSSAANRTTSRPNAAASTQNVNNAAAATSDSSKPVKATTATGTGKSSVAAPKQTVVESSRNYEGELAALTRANEDQTRQYAELKLEVDGLEKERDFYFDKLRDIEILLQDVEEQGQGNAYTAAIFKILYATAEGFQPIDEKVAGGVDGGEAPNDETF